MQSCKKTVASSQGVDLAVSWQLQETRFLSKIQVLCSGIETRHIHQ